MRYPLLCLLALATLLVVGCSDQAPLDPESSNKLGAPDLAPRAVTRPFWGHWQTEIALIIPPIPPEEALIEGTGVATHLGNSSFVTIQPLAPLTPFDAVLTAANGDELRYIAVGDPPEDPPGTDPFSFSGTLEFVPGGTGRFENASGSAIFEGTASLATLTGEVTYIGSITF